MTVEAEPASLVQVALSLASPQTSPNPDLCPSGVWATVLLNSLLLPLPGLKENLVPIGATLVTDSLVLTLELRYVPVAVVRV